MTIPAAIIYLINLAGKKKLNKGVAMDTILLINKCIIVALSAYISFFIAKSTDTDYITKNIKKEYKKLNDKYIDRKLQREVKRYTKTITIKMSLIDKVELFLIDKSNIRRFIPFMNFYFLLFISLLSFIISYIFIYGFLRFFFSSLLIAAVFFFIPAIILEIMGFYNSDYTRRKLAYFISILVQWIDVKEDIVFAFEKSIMAVGEPLRSYIRDMTIQVKRGMETQDALDLLEKKIGNPQFTDFILNIKQSIKYRGDLKLLLKNMEDQFYKLETEFNRRKITTFWDRIYNVIAMILVIVVAYLLIRSNPKALNYYTNTAAGKGYITLFAILYSLSFYNLIGTGRFKH